MSKFSLTSIFIVIAVITIGVWYYVSYNSGQPVAQPKQSRSSVVKANANVGKSGKGASDKSKKGQLDIATTRQIILDDSKGYAALASNPNNYAAMRAAGMRWRLNYEQVFFRNQIIAPDVRQKMLGLLADRSIERDEAEALANGIDNESVRIAEFATAALDDEYEQKLIATLGSEMASRYEHYTKNKECWDAVDRYVLAAAGQGTSLSDDQKYAIARIMSESKTTSLIDLKEKVMPLLASDQQNAFDAYLAEESMVVIGRKIGNEHAERVIEQIRKAKGKAGKKK
jgi:hypothetical protein